MRFGSLRPRFDNRCRRDQHAGKEQHVGRRSDDLFLNTWPLCPLELFSTFHDLCCRTIGNCGYPAHRLVVMILLTAYVLSSVLVGILAESREYNGVRHGFFSLLLTPIGGAISIYYTQKPSKEAANGHGQSGVKRTKRMLNRKISYPSSWKSDTCRVKAKRGKEIPARCFEEFRAWFNEQHVKHSKSENRRLYFPPIVLFTQKERGLHVGKMIRMGEKTGVDDFEKLLAASFLAGERTSRGVVTPLSFTTLLDGKLVDGSSQKVFVLTSLRSGQKELSTAEIINKNGHACASPTFTSADAGAGIMLYVANAFWTGTGAGVRHEVPGVSLTYDPTSTDPGIPRYQELSGSVYVLSNPALPELVKVGYTARCAEVRASELSEAGIPGEWEVTCEIGTNRPKQVMEEAHSRLSHYRHRNEGQFFEVSLRKAARIVKSVAGNYVRVALRR